MLCDKDRALLLKAVGKSAEKGTPSVKSICDYFAESKGDGFDKTDPKKAMPVVDAVYDLFRTGLLAWGATWDDVGPPYCHLTERGERALANFSRDPANPDGYMSYLADIGKLGPVVESYVREALATFGGGHHKAAAVMIGCAAEAIILRLREVVKSYIKRAGKSPRGKLDERGIRTVTRALKAQFDEDRTAMVSDKKGELATAVEDRWPALAARLRDTRNAAGHPASLEKLKEADVHASLHLFHDLFRLTQDLTRWYEEQAK